LEKILESYVTETFDGLVIQISGLLSIVDCGPDGVWTCDFRARLFRKQNLRLAVGDRVGISVNEGERLKKAEDRRGMIESVGTRKSTLRRSRESKRDQVLCANIDHVFVVTSLVDPPYNKGFIDRVLVTVEREQLNASLIFNKMDLITDDEYFDLLVEDLSVYHTLGYKTLFASAKTGHGIDEIRGLLCDSVSVFTGPSGVGKSTLLNTLSPGLSLRTGDIGKSRKGRHVTSSAILLKMPEGGYVVDTPGIRAFGISGLKPEELAGLFRDMASLQQDCRFRDCVHQKEPGCAILCALEDGDFSLERYESYVRIYEDLQVEAARLPRKARTMGRSRSS
jgi:ribosome biogenesis GTPase / thiamine phosphate phosphatase